MTDKYIIAKLTASNKITKKYEEGLLTTCWVAGYKSSFYDFEVALMRTRALIMVEIVKLNYEQPKLDDSNDNGTV